MPKLDAIRFAEALRNKFSESRTEGEVAAGQRDWTSYMFPLFAQIAEEHELWWAGCSAGLTKRTDKGEYREYLWDFTMYERTKEAIWNLPQVIIEHENVHTLEAFRFDHWKTLLSNAPLRIAVGYTSSAAIRQSWVDEINIVARDDVHGWGEREHGQDLIALGFYGMSAGNENFQFWLRKASEREWKKMEF